MVWFKWRQMTSASLSKWKYTDSFPDGTTKQEVFNYLEHCNLLCTWSEHFRHADIVRLKNPPIEIIEKEIKSIKEDLKNSKDKLKRLKFYLGTHYIGRIEY
jgi:hypothetical protein